METKFSVGDEVQVAPDSVGTVRATYKNHKGRELVWVEELEDDGNSFCYSYLPETLTRIEPAEPQAKRIPPILMPVKRRAEDFCPPLTLEKLNARINALELDVSGMRCYVIALPDCPTCGGKVGDGS